MLFLNHLKLKSIIFIELFIINKTVKSTNVVRVDYFVLYE